MGAGGDFDTLVARAGIVRVWHDIDHRRHEPSIESLRALLDAMHLDWRQPADTLVALDAASPPGLPAIAAGFVDEPLHLALRLPACASRGAVRLWATDGEGRTQQAAVDLGRTAGPRGLDRVGRLEATIDWPFAPVPGEYRLRLEGIGLVSEGLFVIAPARCMELEPGFRGAGLSAQAYALRDRRGRAIGDLESLARLGEWFGGLGGAVVLANPLGGPVDPRTPALAPYSPSSRLTIDAVYLPGVAGPRTPPAGDRIGDVAAIRMAALGEMARAHAELLRNPDSDACREFRGWCAMEADWLDPHAIFAARVRQALEGGEGNLGWDGWPSEWQGPRSPAVVAWAAASHAAVDRERHAIWRLERAAVEADRRGRTAGLALGLGHDLPLGCARHGAETWSDPGAFALGASLGAPPDPFCRDGQDWGLPPLLPEELVRRACAPWRRPLRAAMRRGGLVRIDHVMGLDRLWWIPAGGRSADGAYVRYPSTVLLPLLAHDSHAHRCIVVGEDLGTVDPELRGRLARRGVLSTRVLRFERDDDGRFRPPERYPEHAWVTVGTHDLPGAVAHRRGSDFGGVATDDPPTGHGAEVTALASALHDAGFEPGPAEDDVAWLAALHGFLAATPSVLVGIQAEDLVAHAGQVNVPGTVGPGNWSHRLASAIEDWDGLPSVRAVLGALSARRAGTPAGGSAAD